MKRSWFTEEQIVAILREQEAGLGTTEIRCKHGVSSPTFYAWKSSMAAWTSRRRPAEDAGGREHAPQEAACGTMLDAAVLRGVTAKKVVTPAARRQAVSHARAAFELSERRACTNFGFDRTSVRYRSSRVDDRDLRERLRALAE